MKQSLCLIILGLASIHSNAFSPSSPFRSAQLRLSNPLQMAYELVAEPEGGEELKSIDTMADSRMKNMGIHNELKSDEGDVYSFWLTASADGKMIGEYRKQVEKDASRNANFPGFRKGQIPPYAKPQLTMFALQEGIIKTCEAAVAAYGLKALSGSDGSVEVHEDVKEISSGYKIGESVQFTATFAATFDPEKQQSQEEEEVETAVAEED